MVQGGTIARTIQRKIEKGMKCMYLLCTSTVVRKGKIYRLMIPLLGLTDIESKWLYHPKC